LKQRAAFTFHPNLNGGAMLQVSQSGATAIRAMQWVTWADQDYLCARTLLRTGSLVQGASLSNTAIERYLKAIHVIRGLGVPHIHDVVRLYESLKSSGIPPLSESYLRTLVKAYKMRYPDDLEVGFNIALNQPQMLAELDSSTNAIRKGFGFGKADGGAVKTKFDLLREKNAVQLMERNSAFSEHKRAELFVNPVRCYEIRVTPHGSIFDAEYEAYVKDDGNFEREALSPGPS